MRFEQKDNGEAEDYHDDISALYRAYLMLLPGTPHDQRLVKVSKQLDDTVWRIRHSEGKSGKVTPLWE